MDHKNDLTTAVNQTQSHNEAYYLFIVSPIGIVLNIIVIVFVMKRRSLRRMTSAFVIHCCVLDIAKIIMTIYFGHHLLTQIQPPACTIVGQIYVILVTTSAFNLVAMVCAEAYTFEEMNIGGNYRGSVYCIVFGILLVYFGSILLHLGPTIISGYFTFNEKIGYCSFELGQVKSYVANVIWIVIMSMAFMSVLYYIIELYKQIQGNQPNRVSMLVRTSVCLADSPLTERGIKLLVQDCNHRVKLLFGVAIVFMVCWYPYFLLLIIDMKYRVYYKVYQALCFFAWTHSTIEPFIFIVFDRHLRLLARLVYCNDAYFQRLDTLSPLLRRQNIAQSQSSAAIEQMETDATASNTTAERTRIYRPNTVPKEVLMSQYFTEV